MRPANPSRVAALATIRRTSALGRAAGAVGVGIRQCAGEANRRAPDRNLLRLLAQAHQSALVLQAGGQAIAELAAEAGVGASYFTRVPL